MSKEMVARTGKVIGLTEFIDQQIAQRVEVVRDIQDQIASLGDRIQDIKEELRELLEQKGSNWSDSVGYARIMSDGIRKTYDTKALDDLIIKDPMRYGWLNEFRKENVVRGGVQIK